jgi:hypothetical protein
VRSIDPIEVGAQPDPASSRRGDGCPAPGSVMARSPTTSIDTPVAPAIAMYETRLHAPLPLPRFLRRLLLHAIVSLVLIAGSLAIGMAGYGYFEHLPWRDGFLNSAMLLGGMGPVDPPRTDGGKLFAGFYALYAGLVFIIGVSVVLAPIVHRILHKFHWDEKDTGPTETRHMDPDS